MMTLDEMYKSYLGEYYYEWGTYESAMSFEEFCEEVEEFGWGI